MVDFKKLRASKTKLDVTDPTEIFRRLPKPQGITDLYISQAQVLETWYKRRDERDLVIKLHTGGGKTLVGLLIAQSILNELHEPVVYLCPNVQLVEQTLAKAAEYGIPALQYVKNEGFQEDFLNAKSVLISVYQALFNGMSRFGAPGTRRDVLKLGGVILDDAHVSFSTMRESFTLRLERGANENDYKELTNLFRNDFEKIGLLGTFDDVVAGVDFTILEIPYWGWKSKSSQVRRFFQSRSRDYLFSWPFLRDSFDFCHALISRNSFVVTAILPFLDLIPSFSACNRKIFMSATIGDDSSIVRTFDADCDSLSKPITSNSLAGVSERMILTPAFMNINSDIHKLLVSLIAWASEKKKVGAVILVPSASAAQEWTPVSHFADTPEAVAECVKNLQNGTSKGPFVFANRYDGIDLPHNSCRLLIMSGLPRGTSEYEQYLSSIFSYGKNTNSTLAQRIEQGMGRAARGPGDYCVVLLAGKDLAAWIGQQSHLRYLTSNTQAQLEMGIEISKDVDDLKSLARTLDACFSRDKEWIEYHAETLAESISDISVDKGLLMEADIEQQALRLWRDGYYEKAIDKISKYCDESRDLDEESKGWLFQLSARIAYYWGYSEKAQELQRSAYACNRSLMRPQVVPPYVSLSQPSKQSTAIVDNLFRFTQRKGFMAEFDEVVSHLTPEASSNQFERALEKLGSILGFSSERPEKIYRIGPDVLWLMDGDIGFVIEAKSLKDFKNPLTKGQHGQILVSTEWFKKNYPEYTCIAVAVHPNKTATKNAIAENTKALTFDKLNLLISDSRAMFEKLSATVRDRNASIDYCSKLLDDMKLRPKFIIDNYLQSFELKLS